MAWQGMAWLPYKRSDPGSGRQTGDNDVQMMQTLEVASVATRGKSNGVASGRDFAYAAEIGLVGVAPILLHRYDDAAVERRAKAAKNSVMKKADDVDSYVYRTADGAIGMPGRNLKACLRETARSLQDPRSP